MTGDRLQGVRGRGPPIRRKIMELVGTIAVDSGQIMVIDPCYVWNDDFAVGDTPTGGNYDAVCRVTTGDKGFGAIDLGFATGTLYGDGVYPVFAEMVDGKIARLIIDFDPSHEDDDEDEDDEDDEDDDED
jgi:hypothetical protein